MKSQDQIIEQLKSLQQTDLFGFQSDVLVEFLTKESAEILRGIIFKKNANFEDHKEPILSDDEVKKRASEYLTFAFDKALNHRSISASRSRDKLKAWFWLIDLDGEVDWGIYQNYGCPILRQVARLLKIKEPADSRFDRMARGLPCNEFCGEGCEN